ncbi:arsenate reductase ArsC [bacterium]|nr:arsenate reductase ArsC [bacterium]
MSEKKIRVLFLCKHNKARSQMAEALLKFRAGDQFEVHSAGFNPQPVMPAVVQAMAEMGIDIANHPSTDVKKYIGKAYFGYVIIVCSRDELDCPTTFPVPGRLLNWEFKDPAAFTGTEEEILAQTIQVRDEMDAKIKEWIAGF